MNLVETENAAALAEIYGGDLADNGKQAESVEIDGRPVYGNLDFDPSNIDLMLGGTQENVTAAFYTTKDQFPTGLPKVLVSRATCVVGGQQRAYQVRQLNGDKDNRANLNIGLAAYTNRK